MKSTLHYFDYNKCTVLSINVQIKQVVEPLMYHSFLYFIMLFRKQKLKLFWLLFKFIYNQINKITLFLHLFPMHTWHTKS